MGTVGEIQAGRMQPTHRSLERMESLAV